LSFEQIWAPWRLGYIKAADKEQPAAQPQAELDWLPGADRACFLCRYVAAENDGGNLVVCRGPHTITVLNRYPYTNGHLLVAPRQHKARLDELTDGEHVELMQVIVRLTGLLERLMNPQGFNVGLNLGRVAGAGLPGHLHWHVVPRWSGDTNFMPVLAGTNVIPQSLEALWELLTESLAEQT